MVLEARRVMYLKALQGLYRVMGDDGRAMEVLGKIVGVYEKLVKENKIFEPVLAGEYVEMGKSLA